MTTTTHVLSETTGMTRLKAVNWMTYWLAHPDRDSERDRGSEFDRKIGWKRHVYRVPLLGQVATAVSIPMMSKDGLDAIIALTESRVSGHSAYHVHKDGSLRIFAVDVAEDFGGRGIGRRVIRESVSRARDLNLKMIQIGGGNHEFTNKVYRELLEKAQANGLKPYNGRDEVYQRERMPNTLLLK